MITTIRHTGLVVRNLDRALGFYEKLGFTLWKRQLESGEFISKVVGIENVQIETAKLRAPDKSMVELLQYHSHPDQRKLENAPPNQLGCSHIALTVENIDEACQRITDMGGSIVNPPARSADGSVTVAYCHDIDGIILELVEENPHG